MHVGNMVCHNQRDIPEPIVFALTTNKTAKIWVGAITAMSYALSDSKKLLFYVPRKIGAKYF